jgi:hypothetical protein
MSAEDAPASLGPAPMLRGTRKFELASRLRRSPVLYLEGPDVDGFTSGGHASTVATFAPCKMNKLES